MTTAAVVLAPGFFYPFAVGLVAVVNPCGFPLLPAYLGLATEEASGGQQRASRRAERALIAGSCATLGFLVVFGVIGLVVELGLAAFYGHAALVARWVMAAVGVAMLLAGVAALCHRPLRVRVPELGSGLGLRRPIALFVFGASYGIASLGCAWPLFLSGVATTFTYTSFLQGLGAFASYALGMGTFLAVIALVVALFGPAATRRLRFASRFVPLLGGLLLTVIGAYLTLYWVTAIAEPTGSSWPLRFVQAIQQHVSAAVVDHEIVLGAVLGSIIVGTLLVLGLLGARPSISDNSAIDEVSVAKRPTLTEPTESRSTIGAS